MARRTMAWKELRVGILAILGFVILAAALVLISGGQGFFTEKYTLKTSSYSPYGIKEYFIACDHIWKTGENCDGKVVLLPNN